MVTSTPSTGFSFWIDRGGTFTDVIAQLPSGALEARKYLSDDPDRYPDAATFAIQQILKDFGGDLSDITTVKMGTTVATNALLEHKGEPTALFITEGLKDAVLIGQQHRPDLFALNPRRAEPLYQSVFEVKERIAADGSITEPLDTSSLTPLFEAARETGCTSIAIVLAHSYRNPVHEHAVKNAALKFGFQKVVASFEASPLIKLVPRGDTALVDAYLSPILDRYIDLVRSGVNEAPLYFMQSHGGLASHDQFSGKDAILSGPAGGIVGAQVMGAREGITNLITFDMGGTSTDVAHIDGSLARTNESEIAGTRISVPMMDIHTVAAGGGSICRYDGGRFLVGPESAGAYPGPACYGRGGPLTLTDCNLILGRIDPAKFPAIFGENADEPLNEKAARAALTVILDQVAAENGPALTAETAAEGFIRVGIDHMARAIKKVSVRKGRDSAKAALLTFGGAGGQHATLVAEALGMNTVIIPPYSGLLSALGMGLANLRVIREGTIASSLSDEENWREKLVGLEGDARNTLASEGIAEHLQLVDRIAHLREPGSDTSLPVPIGPLDTMVEAFRAAFRQSFGFEAKTDALEIDRLTVEVSGGATSLDMDATIAEAQSDTARVFLNGETVSVSTYEREALPIDDPVTGPAVIFENGGTTLVGPDWQAARTTGSGLVLTKLGHAKKSAAIQLNTVDPIQLEIFNNRFMAIAEEMGTVLARTAHSVNIKERLDFSCALFDADGELIANAPHMPVHLGSMGDSVKACIAAASGFAMGDVMMVNDPFAGGTHLPDITVVAPVYLSGSKEADFYVASRGHHADIGGITPGSMPPNSTTLQEEGVSFSAFPLVKAGEFQTETLSAALGEPPFPARNPSQNIADLKAQVAALARGTKQLKTLLDEYGEATVKRYMAFIQDNAESAVKRLLPRLKSGHYSYPIDNGAMIKVAIKIAKDAKTARIDFTGTSDAGHNNYNAPLSVTKAAVLYVFRTLTGEDIPLNAGCLKPLDIMVPPGCILNPPPGSAVVAGNVETSQAVVNALFLATGTLAAGQGTMNNLIFGNDTYQYYETLAGGMGASAKADGADGLHSHMTNSRLTDIEILETRYPVTVRQLRLRDNTGGDGAFKGGEGLIREIEFHDQMTVSILSLMRSIQPAGLEGGLPGSLGKNLHIAADGTTTNLPYRAEVAVKPGDRIRIETPGGGGFGTKPQP